jgi:galactokinase
VPVPSLPPTLLPFASLLRGSAGDVLQLDGPMWITRAPGCLDLVGGPAEMPGSASVSIATGRSVYSAIQNKDNDEILIRFLRSANKGGNLEWSGKISTIYTKKGPPRSLAVLAAQFEEDGAPWMMEMMAVMIGLRRTHQLNTPKQGFTLVIWDWMPDGAGFGTEAAVATSTALAFKASTGLDKKRVDGIRIARALIYGFKEILGRDLPMTQVLTCAVSQQGCLLAIEHGLDPVMQWLPLPEHVVVASIDAGGGPAAPDMARHASIGARMGLEHLNKVLKKNKLSRRGGWGQVTPAEFEGGLRSHVPTKESGKDWLSKYKNPHDEGLEELVPSDENFRERALSEHHVRESGRARRLLQHLQDYSRTKREDFLAESGRVLNSAHRSLVEKCSFKNDNVTALRAELTSAGRKAGLFGSRLADGGAGSAIMVIGHATAMPRLREIADAHRKSSGLGGQVFHEVGQGGVLDGWWEGVLDADEEKVKDASKDSK